MSSLTCADVEDALPALALDALEEDERTAIVTHLHTCPNCRRAYAEYTALAEGLLNAVPQRLAPPDLKQELLGRIQARRMGWFESWAEWLRGRMVVSRAALGVTFALMLGVIGALGYQTVHLSNQQTQFVAQLELQERAIEFLSDRDKQSVSLTGKETAVGASATILFDPQDNTGMFYAHNLPPVPESLNYQIWLIDTDGKYDNGGVFTVDASSGEVMKLIAAPRPFVAYVRIQVSIEPSGGSPERSGTLVLSYPR